MKSLFNKQKKTPKILIVTGTGRSGTTVLRKSLGLHREIYYNGNENNIFLDLLVTLHKNCTMPSRKVSMELTKKQYNIAIRATIQTFLFPEFEKQRKHYSYFLIASALRPEIIPFMKEVYPDIKVLQIVRNGIEVVSSRMQYDGFKKNPFQDHVDKWNIGVETLFTCEKLLNSKFQYIRHESLLTKEGVENTFNEVFNWLKIKKDAAVIDIVNKKQFHPTKVGLEFNERLNTRQQRWLYWSETERELFKKNAMLNMNQLKYEIPF